MIGCRPAPPVGRARASGNRTMGESEWQRAMGASGRKRAIGASEWKRAIGPQAEARDRRERSWKNQGNKSKPFQ